MYLSYLIPTLVIVYIVYMCDMLSSLHPFLYHLTPLPLPLPLPSFSCASSHYYAHTHIGGSPKDDTQTMFWVWQTWGSLLKVSLGFATIFLPIVQGIS